MCTAAKNLQSKYPELADELHVGITGLPGASYISGEEGDHTFFQVTLDSEGISIVSFTTARPLIMVKASAFVGPQKFLASAVMPLYLLHPKAPKTQLPMGEVTSVGITVRPILRTKTFTVPMMAEPAAFEERPLDVERLGEQIAASGLPKKALVGEPRLELKLPGHWRVTVTFIDPLLLIQQWTPEEIGEMNRL